MNLTIKGRLGTEVATKELIKTQGLVASPYLGKGVFNSLNQVLNFKLGGLNT
jgi:hypothetical protein